MLNHENSTIIIFARQKSSRLNYVVDIIFRIILGHSYLITSDRTSYRTSTKIKINYSKERLLEKEVLIPCSNFLYEKRLKNHIPEIGTSLDLPAAFFTSHKGDFNFDLLAFLFYLLSRYEEYIAPEHAFDHHNRFKAESSIAFKHKFLQLPIVDIWAHKIADLIKHNFPEFAPKLTNFRFIPTYDIDIAWAFKHRHWMRHALIFSKYLLKREFHLLRLRQDVLKQRKKDPFETYDQILQTIGPNPNPAIFFFLLGDLSRYDRNILPKNSHLQQLIRQLGHSHQLGIHPSYQSNKSNTQLQLEIERMANIIDQPVQKSRQHFLKLNFPNTYQNLIQLGIQEDYTMGYAGQVGFRASICRPFPWYDLSKESTTNLMVYPFQIMDGTLKNYLKLSPRESITIGKQIIDITAQYNGTFVLLWHNSSFSTIGGWEDWQQVHNSLCNYAIKTSTNTVN